MYDDDYDYGDEDCRWDDDPSPYEGTYSDGCEDDLWYEVSQGVIGGDSDLWSDMAFG